MGEGLKRAFAAAKATRQKPKVRPGFHAKGSLPSTAPNWKGKCDVCGASPTVGDMDLCGPCTFGEADTAGGNW